MKRKTKRRTYSIYQYENEKGKLRVAICVVVPYIEPILGDVQLDSNNFLQVYLRGNKKSAVKRRAIGMFKFWVRQREKALMDL